MDQKKFQDIWSMNEEQVKELVHNVMEEDRIIHEQQLGLPWQPPDLWVMWLSSHFMISNAEDTCMKANSLSSVPLWSRNWFFF